MHPYIHALKSPDKAAVIVAETGEALSYAALDAASNRVAHFFRAQGLVPGDAAGVFVENTPDYFAIAWGAQRSGIKFVCISTKLTADEVDYILIDSGAKLIIASGALGSVASALSAPLALGTPLVPGILAVLDALDAAGVPYAMGSNGSAEKMQITLGQHGLIPRFKGLFSGQTLGKPKPAPDLYLHAAAALGVDPSACVVIEDSPTGARAARLAGMRCMGYAPQGDAALAAEGAVLFSDMKDLPALLGL